MSATVIEATDPGALAKKDASHGAFYSGFAKGMTSAVDGIILFAQSDTLRQQFWQLMKPIRNAQIAYASTGVLLFLILRDPADDISELFWTISRWGRIVTVLTSTILEYQYGATSAMFFAALKECDPEFGAAVENRTKTRKTMRERFSGLKRAAKLTMFKLAGAIIQKVFPGGKYIAVPAVKFISIRPVLGTGIAAAVSAVHAVPAEILESSRVDDVLVSFGEAVVDADEAGEDSVADYTKRLESAEMRSYFHKRYRGYLAGCGFVYSLLSAVPFLGIPLTLISQCGAACLVTSIVQRNLTKEFRKPLTCEEAIQNKKES
ncbi:unnamed protein product [Agarophyton chilense]|eukprot:gb/GEZJ01001337.1/.p1 GENE.gb/GEZJ01001337.1/~~gb/GEZJ01001337.1/.p1  ORF type:complete len:320 (-),score=46.32 gb/GEZJ01001337.1/:1120-2079(-)